MHLYPFHKKLQEQKKLSPPLPSLPFPPAHDAENREKKNKNKGEGEGERKISGEFMELNARKGYFFGAERAR